MTHDPEDPFAPLRAGVEPPADLRRRVRASLQARGLLGSASPRRLGHLARAAGVVVLLAAGAAVGRWSANPTPPAATEPRFMLLLYDTPTSDRAAPEATKEIEYTAWARGLGDTLELGEKLADRREVLGLGDAGGEAVSGFFVIRAADWNAAEAIARTCPHLRYGGRISLRQIDRT